MKLKIPNISKFNFLMCVLVIFLLAACSPDQPVQEDPVDADIPAAPVDEAPPVEPDQPAEPAQPAEQPADDVVWMEDMLYPGAEFLLEVDGLGGPMTPWRFYAVTDASNDELANYYLAQLPGFVVENDEIIDGIRYLMLAHPEPMGFMSNIEDFEDMLAISAAMDGALLGLEVSHSDIGAGLNRLGMANDMHGIADQIPPNTTILILEFFQDVN